MARCRGLAEEAAVEYGRLTGQRSTASPGLAAALHGDTEGNPLYVSEIVRALVAAQGLPPEPPGAPWLAFQPDTASDVISRLLAHRSARL